MAAITLPVMCLPKIYSSGSGISLHKKFNCKIILAIKPYGSKQNCLHIISAGNKPKFDINGQISPFNTKSIKSNSPQHINTRLAHQKIVPMKSWSIKEKTILNYKIEATSWISCLEPGLVNTMSFWVSSTLVCSLYRGRLFVYYIFSCI